MEKTVVAVIGCGRISEVAHFPALSKMENVRIKYACDLIREKAEEKKEKYGAEEVIEDYRIALNDPEVEVVYVLTQNFAHYTVTMDALEAGKHVFCEKPITVNYELACRMAEKAKESGKLLNIGVCNRYHKSVVEIAEKCKNGELGDVYHIYCSFRSHRSIPGLGGEFTTKASSGGGVLIDWGIHFLDLILYIIGGAKIKTVTADTYAKMAPTIGEYKFNEMWAGPPIENGTNDVEDYVTGYVRTDKCTISFNGAWAENIGDGGMFIDFMGDKKGIRLQYGGQYTVFDNDLNVLSSEGEIPDMYALEDEAFINACKTGEHTKSYIDNILESQRLLQAIYDSAKEGKEIIL